MAIRLPVISEYSPKGIKKMQADLAQLSSKSAKAGYIMKKAFVPASAALSAMATAAVDFAKAAAEDAQGAALLSQALKQTAGATDDQVAATEDYISKLSMSAGVVDDQLRPALATLARATESVTESQDLLAIALDASAATGKPVQEIAKSLARAYTGNLGALNKLLPGMIDTKDETLTFGDAMDKVKEKVDGAAAIVADQKPFDKLQIALDETKESIGAGLLPVIEAVLPKLTGLALWAQNNPGKFKVIAGTIAGVATAIVAVNAAMKVYGAIATIITGINALLTSSYIALYAATGVGIILAIVAAVAVLQAKFDIFGKVVTGLKYAFEFVKDGARIAFDAIKGYVETLIGVWKRVFNGFATAWNATLGGIGFTAPSWLKYIGLGAIAGKEFRIPEIPQLANGGIVTKPTLAMIGEAGPEAVVPLSRGRGLGGDVNITIQGALDPAAVGRQIRQILANDLSRYGRT